MSENTPRSSTHPNVIRSLLKDIAVFVSNISFVLFCVQMVLICACCKQLLPETFVLENSHTDRLPASRLQSHADRLQLEKRHFLKYVMIPYGAWFGSGVV